eukprot:CAMPEP_0175183876 /NCGR_PEP_ID=MMETSP0093-20121207/1081_1 /TAXON_ID=311494 /ORGANISM="Alexandrium monilatum, Strain CCMP3105" /LENGTH=183 /DNA_ID=CAMNT_0016476539 /DNA_START=30 /DNA_END=581 /DNA_ORIENTATION=-
MATSEACGRLSRAQRMASSKRVAGESLTSSVSGLSGRNASLSRSMGLATVTALLRILGLVACRTPMSTPLTSASAAGHAAVGPVARPAGTAADIRGLESCGAAEGGHGELGKLGASLKPSNLKSLVRSAALSDSALLRASLWRRFSDLSRRREPPVARPPSCGAACASTATGASGAALGTASM